MKRAQTIIGAVAAFGSLTLVSAAVAQQNAPTNTKLQRSDRNFITKAAEGGREEVELGRLAQSNASSDAVKQFGQRMVEDHGSANKDLMDLAANKGVRLDGKTPKKDPVLEKLSKLQGRTSTARTSRRWSRTTSRTSRSFAACTPAPSIRI